MRPLKTITLNRPLSGVGGSSGTLREGPGMRLWFDEEQRSYFVGEGQRVLRLPEGSVLYAEEADAGPMLEQARWAAQPGPPPPVLPTRIEQPTVNGPRAIGFSTTGANPPVPMVEVTDRYQRRITVPAHDPLAQGGIPVPAPMAAPATLLGGLDEQGRPLEFLGGPEVNLAAEFPPPSPEELARAAEKRQTLEREAASRGAALGQAAKEHERSVHREMLKHAIVVEASADRRVPSSDVAKLERALDAEQQQNAAAASIVSAQQAQIAQMQRQMAEMQAMLSQPVAAPPAPPPAPKRVRTRKPPPEPGP